MTCVKVLSAGRWWAIAAALGSGLLLAALLRYGILENEAQDLMCRRGGVSGWCRVRATLGWSIHYQLFGLAGLALGVVAWLPGLRRAAFPALLLAAGGLVIYNATPAALALIIALLAALQPSPAAS